MQGARTLAADVAADDLEAVRACLRSEAGRSVLEVPDADGYTPLMRAVMARQLSLRMVDELLAAGADPNAVSRAAYGEGRCVLALAVSAGDPERVRRLLDAGAGLGYSRDTYGVMIDAVHGRELHDDHDLLALLQLLIERGADINPVSRYAESALRVLSRVGRFDAVRLLLAAGGDETQLGWTPLLRSVALGNSEDVREQLAQGGNLEARDCWQRTPWLLAVRSGDVAKATVLREAGADCAARGRCGTPALFHAIDSRSPAMLEWLIGCGGNLDVRDDFGNNALIHAAQHGDATATRRLLGIGFQPGVRKLSVSESWLATVPAELLQTVLQGCEHLGSALTNTFDAKVARLLLDAGANPDDLQFEARRAMLGLPSEPHLALLTCVAKEFTSGWRREFGRSNPERMDKPFWLGMIRSGVTAWQAGEHFGGIHDGSQPIWCAKRFGQSLTFLEDGRIVQVGGEHEDHYDPDFCIYNDVFVHHPDGRIEIYGYPEAVFPPTDFHSATLVGDQIILIGSLGYHGQRRCSETPVYALDTQNIRIERLHPAGTPPGWISRHVARLDSGVIVVEQGKREVWRDNKSHYESWSGCAGLQLDPLRWLAPTEFQLLLAAES